MKIDPHSLPKRADDGNLDALATGEFSRHLDQRELGIKSEFLDRLIVLNVPTCRLDWNDVQCVLAHFVNPGAPSPDSSPGPSYTIRGIELQLATPVTDGLTLQAAGSGTIRSRRTPRV